MQTAVARPGAEVDEVRRTLMGAHRHWVKVAAEYRLTDDVTPDQAVAHMAAHAAALYTYVLAAVLGHARRTYGAAVADDLAALVNDLPANGDSDRLNADVAPS